MKTLLLRGVIAAVVAQGFAYCQPGPVIIHNGGITPQQPKKYSAQEITTIEIDRMLTSPVPITKMNIPLLRRMGDGAATEVLKIMSARGPLSPSEQRNALDMIRKAFENTAAITQKYNKTPTQSLNLLQQLATMTTDTTFRFQIADTQQFILDVTSAK